MERSLLTHVRTWILPVAVAVVAAVLLLVMWTDEDVVNRQDRNLRTLIVVAVSVLLLLAWVGFLAPVSWRFRALGVGGVVGLFLLGAAVFRIEGVSGDLVPVLGFRWAARPEAEPPSLDAPPPVSAPSAAPTGGFAQFRGPNRDGIVPDVNLSPSWEPRPPRLIWRRSVGPAWSGIAVADGKAFTQEQHEDRERVVCYDLASGRPVWTHEDRARYETTLGGIGPRATPAISDGRVYALGATGILNCLDAGSGARVWSVVITRNTGADVPKWGYAGSPLIDGGRVIVQAGGRPGALLAAYDRATGKSVWTGGEGEASYASPTIASLGGRRQIVMLNHASCTGHDLDTGRELWRYAWRGAQPKAAQPVAVGGDRVVISAGYGVGADAFRISPSSGGGWSVEPLWKSQHLKAKFSPFVYRDGHLYGLNDGIFSCIDVETGRRTWRGGRYGHGHVLLSGDLLIVLSEQGELVLLEATPSEHLERSRFPVFEDKTWNTPALAGRLLVVRNDREMACLELPGDE